MTTWNKKNKKQMILPVKLILMFILVFSFGSCKTVKETTKTAVTAKTELNANVKTAAENKQAAETKTVATDKGVTATNTTIKTTATEFSAPDALGKQHPTRQTVTELTTNTKKVGDTKISTEAKAENESKAKTVDKSDFKSDSTAVSTGKKETKTETPGFVSWSIIILIVGLLGLIYYVLKRYGVIK